MKVNILGVQIDKINTSEAIEQVADWIQSSSKHYIVTPNIEFINLAQEDKEFRKILNKADIAIPDSARIGWAESQLNSKNIFVKLINWPFFLFPKRYRFPVTTGVDLMSELIQMSNNEGYTIGLLGGGEGVALKLTEILKKKYPKLRIGLAESDIKVDQNGEVISGGVQIYNQEVPIDILFVAFGQGKQEKWIDKNLNALPVKTMIGVGGAFDYISGSVPRAPKWMRNLGFEWLFRLYKQPWRIKRFGALVKFVFLVLMIKVRSDNVKVSYPERSRKIES